MPRKILISIIILSFVFSLPLAFGEIKKGQMPVDTDLINSGSPVKTVVGMLDVLSAVVRVTYTVFFIAAIMIFLFVAYTYLMAGGDAAAIQKAHQWLIYGVIAVVVAFLAVGVSAIVEDFLKGSAGPVSVPNSEIVKP